MKEQGVKIFTEAQIKKATNNFREMIGEGNLGSVYKGMMLKADLNIEKRDDIDHKSQTNLENTLVPVVIKKAKNIRESPGNHELYEEFSTISKIKHNNVVKLLGVCLETKVPTLVFEYISNGSLSDRIYGKVNWTFRGRSASK